MRFKHWCVFLCLVTLVALSGVKMQEKAPAHITTGKVYLDDYAANALLTTEEFRTVALLQRIQIKFATLEEIEKDRFANTLTELETFPGMHGLNMPKLRANLDIPATEEHVEEKSKDVDNGPSPNNILEVTVEVDQSSSTRSRRPTTATAQDYDEGHLIYQVGNLLHNRYKIMAELGEGYYGKVFMCNDLHKGTILAIKIIKNIKNENVKYQQDMAMRDIKVLSKLANYHPKGKNMFVQMYDWFDYHGHKCIVFELLGKSVGRFLKDNNYSAYPIEHVRQIAYELCLSVSYLHASRLTHNDLKLENILFHDTEYYMDFLTQEDRDKGKKVMILKNPEIRLIDFGHTTFDHVQPSKKPRQDTAPEVIMELGFGQPSDVWSVGCIIFEMAMGFKMFDTPSRHEHLAMMERILGQIPSKMAEKSKLKYFLKGKLRWDEDSSIGRHVRSKVKPLLSYISMEKRGNKDWEELFQMISQMLRYEPGKRSTLAECLEHPFLKKFKLRGPSRFTSSYISR